MASVRMDNSGRGKIQVPGFNDIELTYELPPERRFTHGINEYAQIPAVTAREFAMTATMNDITDKPGWHRTILDDRAVSAWKHEMFERHLLLSDKAWDWCLAELRSKAVEYQEKQFVRVLDTGSCVCKSDTILDACVSTDLEESLASPSRKTSSAQMRYIVDSTLYPLVYGETKVLQEGGTVPFDYDDTDAMLMLYKDAVLCGRLPGFAVDSKHMEQILQDHADMRRKAHNVNTGREHIATDQYWWSATYQCLPCDIEFIGAGAIKIVSYINNLHPSHMIAYKAIERIMSASVKMWDECLIMGVVGGKRGLEATKVDNVFRFGHQRQRGRYPLRIITFGVDWHDQLPKWARPLCSDHVEEFDEYTRARAYKEEEEVNQATPDSALSWEAHLSLDQYSHFEGVPPISDATDETLQLAAQYTGRDLGELNSDQIQWLIRDEADARRFWTHPEPGTAFSYEDWESDGSVVHKAVVKMVKRPRQYKGHWLHSCQEPTHERYSVNLEKSFHDTGLQIVVNVSEITLQPGDKHVGEWRLDGHLNEHIVARACFVYNASNVKCCISLCQETPMYAMAYRYAGDRQAMSEDDNPSEWRYDSLSFDDNLQAIAEAFGWPSSDVLDSGEFYWNTNLPVQDTGSIQLTQGRLITFPNVFEQRLQAESIDKGLSACVRMVWLDLVDPHYRICSTRNVPPQQPGWYARYVNKLLMKRGLPAELCAIITKDYDYPMSQERATEHRLNMRREQGWIQVARHNDMTSFHFSDPQEF